MPPEQPESLTNPSVTSIATAKGALALRPAQPADIPAYITMRLAALQAHPEAFGSAYEETLARPPEFWEQRLASTPYKCTFLVVTPTGTLAGMTGIWREEGVKLRHNATIIGVYVDPAWRGLRLTDALIERCIAWSRDHDVRMLRLTVTATNTPALRAYLRCGFSIYGVDPQVIFTGGRYYDDLLMVQQLVLP
ncbi:MAG: GNAT family N-acetyltransferase [Armatimonadetes bacterium]|nr:GNAT family N-acetyltransferase [Anaerolineae bacterium]